MKKEKEEKEPMIEDMRHVVSTLNFLEESFNYELKDANATIKMITSSWYDAGCLDDLVRTLYEEEDWKHYLHDAKLVNRAMRKEYYPTDKAKAIEQVRDYYDENFNLE